MTPSTVQSTFPWHRLCNTDHRTFSFLSFSLSCNGFPRHAFWISLWRAISPWETCETEVSNTVGNTERSRSREGMCWGRGNGGTSDHNECEWDMTHDNDEQVFLKVDAPYVAERSWPTREKRLRVQRARGTVWCLHFTYKGMAFACKRNPWHLTISLNTCTQHSAIPVDNHHDVADDDQEVEYGHHVQPEFGSTDHATDCSALLVARSDFSVAAWSVQ